MRFLSICPRIRKQGERLVISTSIFVWLLFLGSLYRIVLVDPSGQWIAVNSRYLWFIRRRRKIPFTSILAITYGYEDVSADSWFSSTYNTYDWFKVGLRLNDESEVHLFNFVGEGSFVNESVLPDWFFWADYTFDITGAQESESRLLVDLLAQMINVKVIPPK
ncbi:MAG: hypothetical protein ACKVT0_03650 [Planctomycetaceae bacterium]